MPVAAVAGHSVGAFAAAVIAGVLPFAEAIRVVRMRGDAMTDACADGDWGMAAVRGLPESAVAELAAALASDADPLSVATVNAADQIVVAGTRPALDRLADAAPASGAGDVVPIDIPVASHCRVQAATADLLASALATVETGRQRCAYFANGTGRRIRAASGRVVDDLATSVRQPVRWFDIARVLPEFGITAVVEMPPGHVLAGLSRQSAPRLPAYAIDDIGIDAATRRAWPD